MAREKLRRAAAYIVRGRKWREYGLGDVDIVQMALPTVHENERAGQANAICAHDVRLDECRVFPTTQDVGLHLNIAGQGADKCDLCGLERRQILRSQLRRLIGQRRT